MQNKVHGHYLEDFGPYTSLFCLHENDGEAICNAFLRRAGFDLPVEGMMNKAFVAVATNFGRVMVLYVYDRTYIFASVAYDQYAKKLKTRQPNWDVDQLLLSLPRF